MTVTHVQKARKANKEAGIKVGDEYWRWSRPSGGRFVTSYFKTAPRPSQVTSSDFLSSAYALGEQCEDIIVNLRLTGKCSYNAPDELVGDVDSLVSEIRGLGEEQSDKKSNMPDSLQDSDTGQLLEERAEACETCASELESAISEIEAIDVLESDPMDWRDEAAEILDGVSWDF